MSTETRIRGALVVLLMACSSGGGDDGGFDGGAISAKDAGVDAASEDDAATGPDSGIGIDADSGSSSNCNAGSGGVCDRCLQEKCADLLAVCQRNDDCACMARCLGENGVGGVQTCLTAQGFLERPPSFGSLEECVAVACPDGDECSTPAGWTPPVDVACVGSAAGIGGGSLADCSFDPLLQFDPDGAILQLESGDGSVCARIARRNDGPGSLANTSWTLVEIQVGPIGQVALVDQSSAGCWYSSHHNFRDWIHAWTGTRHFDLVLKLYGHAGARTYDLYVFEQGPIDAASCAPTADGTMCIDGPIELFPFNP